MKKIMLAVLAIAALCACSNAPKAPFNYRGLALSLPVNQFVDSLKARGFSVDSVASDSGRVVVLANPAEHYRVVAGYKDETIAAVQETYSLSTNDSTRQMWQELRDGLEKELDAWPDCPILKDDHKVANFDSGDGIISVILENTYTPTLTVRYTKKSDQ